MSQVVLRQQGALIFDLFFIFCYFYFNIPVEGLLSGVTCNIILTISCISFEYLSEILLYCPIELEINKCLLL